MNTPLLQELMTSYLPPVLRHLLLAERKMEGSRNCERIGSITNRGRLVFLGPLLVPLLPITLAGSLRGLST